MMNFRDKEIQHHGESSKQQVGDSTKVMVGASSSSRQWSSGFKNPRIVRVSRTFGGKDRHSKVCTIKGLRDRRIRLSVPTAIQLYDLQDRLGLSQPSKVIDWLLDSTKHDIDKLPPLPIIPGTFPTFHQATYGSQGYRAPQSSPYTPFLDANLLPLRKEGININSDHQGVEVDDREQSLVAKLKYWDSSMVTRLKQKGVDHDRGGVGESINSQVSAQNFFPIASSSNASMLPPPSLLSTNPMLNYWEPSTLSLTQFGGLGSSSQSDHHQGAQGNSTNVPSSLSLSSGSQLFLYPSMTNPSYLPPQNTLLNSHNHQVESDLRNQFNRSHLLSNFHSSSDLHSSSRLDLKPFPFSMNHHPDHLHQNHDERHQDKRN